MNDQLKLEDLVIGYRGQAVLSKPIFLSIAKGSFWGLVGPNGAGKTTLVKTILGILPPVAGGIWKAKGTRFGYVPQRGTLDDIFPLSVLDVVLMGCFGHLGPMRWTKKTDRERARHFLNRVGLSHLERRPFRVLSGGQKQRVLVARGLTGEPDILFLDEPTDGMDLAGESRMMALISGLQKESGLTIVMITHILNLVSNFAERLILIHGKEALFEAGPTQALLTTERLRAIYRLDIDVHRIAHGPEGKGFLFVHHHVHGKKGLELKEDAGG